MKRAIAAGAAIAAILVPVAAEAGINNATMVADPNPAMLGDTITVTNSANANSTCEFPGEVNFQLLDPTNAVTDTATIVPDEAGNWSYVFVGDMTGTWTAIADCDADVPAADPFFFYADLPIVVQAPPGTTAVTLPPSSTTTTAAAAVTVTPAFTG